MTTRVVSTLVPGHTHDRSRISALLEPLGQVTATTRTHRSRRRAGDDVLAGDDDVLAGDDDVLADDDDSAGDVIIG